MVFHVPHVSKTVRIEITNVQNHFQNKLMSLDFQSAGNAKGPKVRSKIKIAHQRRYHFSRRAGVWDPALDDCFALSSLTMLTISNQNIKCFK